MSWDEGEAEPDPVVVREERAFADLAHHSAGAIAAVPTAPARHAAQAVEVPIGIQAPFPYIPTHIIQAKFIGLFLSNRVCLTTGIFTPPRNFVNVITAAVFIPLALVPAAGGILPLGSCGLFRGYNPH